MKHIPNIISALRIIVATCLLFCNPAAVAFWVIYGLCGISDMLDGYLARKLRVESKTGAVKIVNQVSALIVCKRFCFPHTKANKLTGLLLFLSVPTVFWSVAPLAFVAGIASFAAIQEGHFIWTCHNLFS